MVCTLVIRVRDSSSSLDKLSTRNKTVTEIEFKFYSMLLSSLKLLPENCNADLVHMYFSLSSL